MRKLSIILILNLSFLSFYTFAQTYEWTDLSSNLPELGGFSDVHFVGQEGWITGGNDKIFYTSDSGKEGTFTTLNMPTGTGITSSIFMKNSTEGYTVTFSGNILHGVNNVWTTLFYPGGVLNSVHFPPLSSKGFTCGNNGKVWSFDNSGISDISPSGVFTNHKSVNAPSNLNDVKVCGETYIGRNLNNSWANLQLYDSTIFYNSLYFIENNLGWSVGLNGTIIHVSDGINWTQQTSNTSYELNDIFFITSLEGWVVGNGIIIHTTDGGNTWIQEAADLTTGKILRAVYFTSSNSGYVVGNNTLLRYGLPLSTKDDNSIPLSFELKQNYPNPFNPNTFIEFSTKEENMVILKIYDIGGNDVATILNDKLKAGNHQVEFNAENLTNGTYMYKLQVGDEIQTKKMVVLR